MNTENKNVTEKKLNKRMIHFRLYLVFASLAVIGIIFAVSNFGGTLAWYNDTQTQDMGMSSAKVYYTLTADSSEGAVVQPNENLFSSLTLTNYSTAASDIRFKIEYDYYTNTGSAAEPVYTKNTGEVKVAPDANAEGAPGDQFFDFNWDIDADSGFSYAADGDSGWWQKKASIPAVGEASLNTGEVVNVLANSSFICRYNGKRTGNEFAGKPVSVTITFQAKQAQGVTWQNIGTVTAYVPVSGG